MPALVLRLPEPGHAAPAPAPEAPNLPPAELCCSSYARALAHRKSARSTAAPSPATSASQAPASGAERPWVLTNCRVLDADAGAYLPDLQRIVLYGGKVVAVEAVVRQGGEAAAAAGQQEQQQGEQEEWLAGLGLPPAAAVADCGGAVVMAGAAGGIGDGSQRGYGCNKRGWSKRDQKGYTYMQQWVGMRWGFRTSGQLLPVEGKK